LRILVAESLAIIVVLVVETLTGERDIVGFRMAGLASAHSRPQRFDQPARAQAAREGVIAQGAVQLVAR